MMSCSVICVVGMCCSVVSDSMLSDYVFFFVFFFFKQKTAYEI